MVDVDGNELAPQRVGVFPDKEGDDIDGYKFVETKTDEDGNVINVYQKKPNVVITKWVDKEGNPLQDPKEGTYPDKEGDDIPKYKLVEVKTDKDGNTINVYEKIVEEKKITTSWVDTDGNPLKETVEGTYPDKEGDDIDGYELVETKTDKDGNTINVYKKKASTPTSTAQPTDNPTTPAATVATAVTTALKNNISSAFAVMAASLAVLTGVLKTRKKEQ